MNIDYYQLPTGKVRILSERTPFPPIEEALEEPNGLIAIGGDLSEQRLLSAYHQGIYPWFSEGEPVIWWSPDPRMVLFPNELKISKSLSKRLKKQDFEIRYSYAFEEVMKACANANRKNQNGTWITNEIIEGYTRLAKAGYALSVETWIDNQLVGGLYGVKIGRMFYGESMFHLVTDASKIAFVHLVYYLRQHAVGMIDCQMKTAHLASLGARLIPRSEFLSRLMELTKEQP